MARLPATYQLPDGEEVPIPWDSLIRQPAPGMRPAAVGNASPAEAPGQTAEAYAQAAAAEKEAGNEDAAARLAVRATETRTQEQAAAGSPEPTTPLPQVAPASQAKPKQPTLNEGLELQAPALGEASAWGTLASYRTPEPTPQQQMRGDMNDPALYAPLEQPPEYRAPSKAGSITALVLDGLMNKGRNAGRLVGRLAESGSDGAFQSWKRRADAAQAAATLDATKRRGLLTPEEEEYKRRRLEIAEAGLGLREDQIAAQIDSIKLRKDKQRAELEADSPEAKRIAERLVARGVPREALTDADGRVLSIYEQKQLSPAIKNDIEIAMSGEMAGVAAEKANAVANATDDNKIRVAEGISDATQANKIELAGVGAATAASARAETQAIAETNRVTDFKTKFAENTAEELTIASMMDRVDALGGASPDELAERLPDVLASWGISSPERMEAWQGKKMILEKWGRSQSGAAISMSEDDKFKIQAASRGDASPAQIEAAWKIMDRTIATRLKTRAAGDPESARGVLDFAGVDSNRWIGSAAATPQAAPRRAPGQRRNQRPKPQPVVEMPAEVDDSALDGF